MVRTRNEMPTFAAGVSRQVPKQRVHGCNLSNQAKHPPNA